MAHFTPASEETTLSSTRGDKDDPQSYTGDIRILSEDCNNAQFPLCLLCIANKRNQLNEHFCSKKSLSFSLGIMSSILLKTSSIYGKDNFLA